MTPFEAIQAATINAAELFGIAERAGSLEVGKSADLIAIVGDPTSDVSVLEQVQFVMKQGLVYKQ